MSLRYSSQLENVINKTKIRIIMIRTLAKNSWGCYADTLQIATIAWARSANTQEDQRATKHYNMHSY